MAPQPFRLVHASVELSLMILGCGRLSTHNCAAEPAADPQILLLALVLFGDLLGQLLAVVERIIDTLLARDHRRDVIADLGAQIGELRDVDKLDTDRWPWLDTRVDRVSSLDRLQRRLSER